MFEYKKNPAIREYTTQKGVKKYMFQIYIGINPNTNKKTKTTRRGFKTPALANAEFRKIEAQVKNDKYSFTEDESNPVNKTFKEVYEDWFAEVYSFSVQSSTIYKTKQIFDCHILPKIGNLPITAITSDQLQPIVNDWVTVYTKLNIISRYANRVFKYAYTLNIINSNPMDHVLLPSRGVTKFKEERTNFFDSAELERFTRYLVNNKGTKVELTHAVFFIVMAYTGLRKGELLALEWSDIDFDKMILDVNKTLATNQYGKLSSQQPKWASFRKIEINNLVADTLKDYHEYLKTVLRDPELVFPSNKNTWRNLGKPNVWLKSIIDQGTEDFAQIYAMTKDPDYKTFVHQITPHGLRHTHATWLFERDSTITPKAVQKRLGHKTIGVTLDIYTHATSQQFDKIKSALDVTF